MDFGKYLYKQAKEERLAFKKRKEVELKEIRIGLGTGDHDLDLKARRASDFLREGNRVRVDMRLRGREKYLERKFLESRFLKLLKFLTEEYIVVQGPSYGPRGVTGILERKISKK